MQMIFFSQELVWGTKISQLEPLNGDSGQTLVPGAGLPLPSSPPLGSLPLTPTWEMLQVTVLNLQ